MRAKRNSSRDRQGHSVVERILCGSGLLCPVISLCMHSLPFFSLSFVAYTLAPLCPVMWLWMSFTYLLHLFSAFSPMEAQSGLHHSFLQCVLTTTLRTGLGWECERPKVTHPAAMAQWGLEHGSPRTSPSTLITTLQFLAHIGLWLLDSWFGAAEDHCCKLLFPKPLVSDRSRWVALLVLQQQ